MLFSFFLDKQSELDSSELNSLIADGNLGLLDFLDPTTGVPTPIRMAEDNSVYNPQNLPVSNGYSNLPAGGNSVMQGQQGYEGGDREVWFSEQNKKLEKQHALQQQKLLELEQACS